MIAMATTMDGTKGHGREVPLVSWDHSRQKERKRIGKEKKTKSPD
jgi:hypothetical protein